MTDFHLFEAGGVNYLFFPSSARLYQLSKAALGTLCRLSGAPHPADISAALRALPHDAPADQAVLSAEPGDLSAELDDLLQKELTVAQPASAAMQNAPGRNGFHSFSLYLAQSCNMSCCYCWNRGGSFGKPSGLMGEQTAQLVTELILSLAEGSSADKIFINFYGGEPLLNFPVLKQITLRLRQQEARLAKNFCFTVDTNGSLLEGETAQFLARHFVQIGVSLDGRQEIHDVQRPGFNGEVTWERIVANVRAFPNRKLLCLRATLTTLSDPYLETFRQLTTLGVRRIQLEYCHETGYQENPVYQELIVPPERQFEELREFLDYYVDTVSLYQNSSDIPFVSSLMDNITRIRRGNRYTRPCGAGMNMLAISSRGEVFPCIAFVEREEFAMGRADTGSPLSLHQTLADFEVDGQVPCHACWLRYDCAGGCYATHYDMTGHARQPHPQYCKNMKAKAEIYLYAMAQMLKKCPWHLERDSDSPGAPYSA
ncbi:MAG: radical SAM/SPASM domain-containing protein [Geobacteraceae bacterium GWC2_58_44]|nr:MAG: radical SAM/SPASM domain-containing protein [Geobacteraceae bacterium GWC2_58_44]HBG07514.1 radical SAM/SPASM domain-containing protein [Geobacter sp.]